MTAVLTGYLARNSKIIVVFGRVFTSDTDVTEVKLN